jgi:hypothetical protein
LEISRLWACLGLILFVFDTGGVQFCRGPGDYFWRPAAGQSTGNLAGAGLAGGAFSRKPLLYIQQQIIKK